jgi:hypothetical protein
MCYRRALRLRRSCRRHAKQGQTLESRCPAGGKGRGKKRQKGSGGAADKENQEQQQQQQQPAGRRGRRGWQSGSGAAPAAPAAGPRGELVLSVENKTPIHDVFQFQKVSGGLARAGSYQLWWAAAAAGAAWCAGSAPPQAGPRWGADACRARADSPRCCLATCCRYQLRPEVPGSSANVCIDIYARSGRPVRLELQVCAKGLS